MCFNFAFVETLDAALQSKKSVCAESHLRHNAETQRAEQEYRKCVRTAFFSVPEQLFGTYGSADGAIGILVMLSVHSFAVAICYSLAIII